MHALTFPHCLYHFQDFRRLTTIPVRLSEVDARWNQISGIPLWGYSGESYKIIIRSLVWLRICLALVGRLGVELMLHSKFAVGIEEYEIPEFGIPFVCGSSRKGHL
jgi:hypothetical protein